MPPPSSPSVAALFGELAELPTAARRERLAVLDTDAPEVARELRALLDAGDGARADAFSPPGGARVGPYRIVRELGRGGMATVWLAHDDRLDRPVALKCLRDAWPGGGERGGAGAAAKARFAVEARAAAALDHPHVAGVYDVGEGADGRLYIAMAYCAGGSLADRLASGVMAPGDAARVAAQVADALGAAHARGIVHRDVKPANVLFDATGAARLADFGIAKLPGHDATRTGTVVGTVAYMAPEQVRGEPADHRADLWALGVTLYEMLAGRRPFAGNSHASLMHAVLGASPPPLSDVAAAVPLPLDALVRRLLAKHPGDRPASAAAVAAELARFATARANPAVGASGPHVAAPAAPSREGSVTTTPAPSGGPVAAPLVGREQEVAAAAALLRDTRLLTLTGPGGTGKTRLALELARVAAGAYADGARVVLLAPLAEADLVPVAVAQALGLRPDAALGPDEQLAAYFAERETLLVLDNFEHVLGAAPLVRALVAGAPGLTVLVTSREPLRLVAEQEFPVPPLTLPARAAATADAVGEAEAVRLFVQRARAGRPDFALTDANAADVAALCRRLDGLPLAIELAAARVKLLSPRAILTRLERSFDLLRSDARDAEPRHRTLRGAIDWSYTLLGPDEQRLFRALATCAGGFTLDAAAAFDGGDGADGATPPADALDRVASLVDKSLVVRREQKEAADGEPRFFLLETVREFARERLTAAGEADAAAEAHARHYLALAESVMPAIELGQPDPAELARLGVERDNLRAAAAWALAAARRDAAAFGALALRLANALFWYWYAAGHWLERGQFGEARAFTTAALGMDVPADPLLRARALMAAGLSAHPQGAYAEARDRFAEAQAIARATPGARALDVFATCKLGAAHLMLGDLDAAWACSEEAHALAAAEPPGMLHSFVGVWRAMTAIERGDVATAREVAAADRAEGMALGHSVVVAHSTAILGRADLRAGDLDAAGARLVESLRIHQEIADAWGLALDLEWLSALAAARGRHADGARFMGAVDALRERAGMAILGVDRAGRARREADAREALGDGAYGRAHAEGAALPPGALAALAAGIAAGRDIA